MLLEEIKDFHAGHKEKLSDIPYCWCNILTSLDGILSFDKGPNILIPQFKDEKIIDQRLLQASWMEADAVLITGKILREEPELICIPYEKELLQLKKKLPKQLILTSSGDIPPDHIIFKRTDLEVILISTETGISKLKSLSFPNNVQFLSVSTNQKNPNLINLKEMFQKLKSEFSIDFLDLSSGGILLEQLIQEELIHEFRYSLSCLIAGGKNSRPSMSIFKFHYQPDNCPILEILKLKHTKHFIHFRAKVDYRNLLE